jgi:hypothetical protein
LRRFSSVMPCNGSRGWLSGEGIAFHSIVGGAVVEGNGISGSQNYFRVGPPASNWAWQTRPSPPPSAKSVGFLEVSADREKDFLNDRPIQELSGIGGADVRCQPPTCMWW